MKNIIKEEYESHGNNWGAVIDNFGMDKLVEIAKLITENKTSIHKVKGDFLGIIGFEPPFQVLLLNYRNKDNYEIYSLYPFFRIGNPVDVKISKIDEWDNKCEAVIEGSLANGTYITFFDTLYFLNKEKYVIGQSYKFNLVGLAHNFKKRIENLQFSPSSGPLKGEKFDSTCMTGYAPIDKYGGEFSFYSPFESFLGSVEFMGSKFHVHAFYQNTSNKDIVLRFPLFIREQTLKGYKPQPNDPIEGTAWLQGYLIDSLR